MTHTSPRVPPWPAHLAPRPWQAAMLETALEHLDHPQRKDFFAAVCPGAGKTVGALLVFRALLQRGDVRRLFVVVHTDHLRAQWIEAAEEVGFGVTPKVPASNRDWPDRHHVLVLTYQQIEKNPDAVRRLVTDSYRTAVAFDEIHHTGDGQAWAAGIKTAFGKAKARLHLTGTPFRNDGRPIPYARYDKRYHRLVTDFKLDYAEALRAGAYVIPSYFFTYGLTGAARRGDDAFSLSFDDGVGEANAAMHLNMAIESRTWLARLIEDAHERLLRVRGEQMADAGGLVVAKDQAHARFVRDLVEEITGEEAVLVISDEPESSARIAAFRESSEAWIVAVKMISEGVDIPRLRVGVYATNVRSDLFLWQWVGRFIRFVNGVQGSQAAYLFIPAHPDLLVYASEIRDQRLHVLPPPRSAGEKVERARAAEPSDEPGVEVLEAQAVVGAVVAGADEFAPAEIEAALDFMRRAAFVRYTPAQVALWLREFAPEELLEAHAFALASGAQETTPADAARILRQVRQGQ